MVKVCTGAAVFKAAERLGPYVLSVPAGSACAVVIPISRDTGIDKTNVTAAVYAVRLVRIILAIVVIRDLRVRSVRAGTDKGTKLGKKRGCAQIIKLTVKRVIIRVIILSLIAERCAYGISVTVVFCCLRLCCRKRGERGGKYE